MNKNIKIIIGLVIALLVVTVGFFYLSNNPKEDNKTNPGQQNQGNDITDVVKDKTTLTQGDFVLSNISFSSEGAANVARGSIKNNGSSNKVSLELKMKDSTTGRLVGTATEIIEGFGTNETKAFEISIIGDYTKANEFEIVVKAN